MAVDKPQPWPAAV